MFSLTPGGKHTSYRLSGPGTLEIKKFDVTGIAGTFEFSAQSHEQKSVSVKGSFDYACSGASVCK
jgi:hypothetical protein